MSKPNFITYIRKELGMTQAQLAAQLGIERGKLSMAELGKRKLSANELAQLSDLLQQVAYCKDQSSAAKEADAGETLLLLQAELKEYDYQTQHLQHKLELMMQRHRKNCKRKRWLSDQPLPQELYTELSDMDETTKHQLRNGLQANGTAAQIRVQLELEALQYKIQRVEELVQLLMKSVG